MKYFHPQEFRCRCGRCELSQRPRYPMSYELQVYLDALRLATGAPIYITSGWRCEVHNAAVGGAKKSDHLYGCAADITAKDFRALQAAHEKIFLLLPEYHRIYDEIHEDRQYIHISLWGGVVYDAEITGE